LEGLRSFLGRDYPPEAWDDFDFNVGLCFHRAVNDADAVTIELSRRSCLDIGGDRVGQRRTVSAMGNGGSTAFRAWIRPTFRVTTYHYRFMERVLGHVFDTWDDFDFNIGLCFHLTLSLHWVLLACSRESGWKNVGIDM